MYNLTNWLIKTPWPGSFIIVTSCIAAWDRAASPRRAAPQSCRRRRREFAEHGIAGARTDAIAREARVNKALLYYYFKDKETLYGAVLDDAFSGLKETVFRVLDSDLPPREKMLAYAGAYFDFVASNQLYPAADAARDDAGA